MTRPVEDPGELVETKEDRELVRGTRFATTRGCGSSAACRVTDGRREGPGMSIGPSEAETL